MPRIYPPVEERFWSKVDKNGPTPVLTPELGPCWIWTAGANGNGYGAFSLTKDGRKSQMASHRMGWILQHEQIPPGLNVLHKCDNPLCVRGTHLFLGTVQDNSDDMVRKGRSATGDRHMSRLYPEALARGEKNGKYTKPECTPRGEKHGMSKLTEADVRGIRARFILARPPMSQIARDHGVTTALIRFIVRGEIWRHVA